jgi:DtxR family Mn-dependent transcriptional regulator
VGDARVCDQHVHAAELAQRAGDRAGVPHIGLEHPMVVAGQRGRELLEPAPRARHEPERATAGGEGAGDRLADSARGAGDEHAAAGAEVHGRGRIVARVAWAAMSHEQATVAEEEYLQIIYWLQEAGLPITGANIARAMQVSAPTVHEMIGRLEQDGYVTRNSDKSLEFTETGHDHAAQIVRRHRLIERFLTDVFDIPWDQVHEEAERLEHWMSPVVEERMLRAIGDAKTCPHGHPIFEGERETGVPLADVAQGATVRVLRFENEAEDLLHYLKDSGLQPGLEGTLTEAGGGEVVLEAGGERHAITRSVAETVSVVADPSPPARTALPDQLVLGKERYGR